jgi:hypothetical protein
LSEAGSFDYVKGTAMGLTCATIHVLAGHLHDTTSKAEADRLIHAACRRLGYEPVEEPAAADRRLAVIGGPSWLSVLDQEDPGLVCEGMVDFRDDDAFAAIRSTTESWIRGLPTATGAGVRIRYEGLLDEFGNNSKRKAQLSLADVGPSKKWQKFFQTPAALQSLFIEVVNDKGQAFAGVNIQRPNTYSAARATIHLSLWWVRLGSDIDGDMRDRMVRLVDQVFTTLPGLQGWLAEWDWTPLFSTADDNNYTPYEDAYGLSRSFDEGPIDEAGGFMSRGWCKGTLRGLGSPLWLGRDLLAFISRPELEKVARVQEIGPFAVRVETAADDLRQLEEVLERILPRAAKAGAQP